MKENGNEEALARDGCHLRAVTGISPAVFHRGQTFVFARNESESIVESFAIVEFSALKHLPWKRGTTDTGLIEVVIPEREIFDRGVQTSCPGRVKVGETHAETSALFGFVSIGIVFDDHAVVVTEKCMGHAERFKDILGSELTKRCAADALDDNGHQRVARVAVDVFLSRLEIQVFLGREDRHDVIIRNQVERITPSGELEQIPLIAKAAGVIDEVADGNE